MVISPSDLLEIEILRQDFRDDHETYILSINVFLIIVLWRDDGQNSARTADQTQKSGIALKH